MSFVCEACFHPNAPDVRLASYALGYFCERCVVGALNGLDDGRSVVVDGLACILCGRERPGVRLAPDSDHAVCVVCGPILQQIHTIHSDVDELAHNGYCVLRGHFAPSLIDACRTALWPTLLAHVERHEPNRGAHRHYFAMPFDPPCFAPDLFFNDAILRIVRGAMDDRVVADQWGCDVPLEGSTYQDVHVDYARPLFAESPEIVLPPYMLVVSVALSRIARVNGPIEIAPGTHRMPRAGALSAVEAGTISLRPVELDVGDVLIRHPWALHRGSPNTTSTPRALLSIRYVRRWYADDSREVNSIPRAIWNSFSDAQQRIMRFPVAEV